MRAKIMPKNNLCKAKIDKPQEISKCGLCVKKDEAINKINLEIIKEVAGLGGKGNQLGTVLINTFRYG